MDIEHYKALPYHKQNSSYGIEIINKPSYNIVTIFELSDIINYMCYEGMSITNGMESIVEDILKKYKEITLDNSIFIECYSKNKEPYSIVEYKDKKVSWKYISKKDFYNLLNS